MDGPDLQKVDPLIVAAERRLNGQIYSTEHELARRQLQNSIWELYLRMNSEEVAKMLGTERESINRQVLSEIINFQSMYDLLQFTHLLAQSRALSVVDRADEWHKRALDRVAERIQETLQRLQNPEDCDKARLMICEAS